ncbi:MAG: hypothetical protein WCF78_04200 [archaeon]
MPEIKINVPDRMYFFMKKHSKKDWDLFFLKAIDKELRKLQLLADLRCCKEGEKAMERGECIPFDDLIKEMGLEKEFKAKKKKEKDVNARKK